MNKRKIIVAILLLASVLGFAQQESTIKVTGNKNDATNIQKGKDSAQKSAIDVNGDSNKVLSTQIMPDTTSTKKEPNGFMDFMTNSNTIAGLIVSLAMLFGLIKGIPFFKKLNKKK